MPIRLSRTTLAALGLLRVMAGGAPASSGSGDSDPHSGLPAFDNLVETGEEVYDNMLLRAKDRRDRIENDIKTGLSKILSDLGLATHEEIRKLRDEIGNGGERSAPDSESESVGCE